ncbi:MAG TPA: hypothetical protein VMH83_01350 [Candidatus Acidoferrum sp.]|nr:hypothetical protein [Candidatus Acidoferrum sp.]
MNMSVDSTTAQPKPAQLWRSVLLAAVAAAAILVLVVLPAEYGIDPTGFGGAIGLTKMAAPSTKLITLTDNIGGNQTLRQAAVPDPGQPTPLPNPAVFQDQPQPPTTRTLQVVVPAGKGTEVKLKMQEGKVALFSWSSGSDKVYADYHGHDPSFGPEFFVRYKEDQENTGGNGSLTAPFSGEHGWFWLNINDHPVTITLTATGYFDDVIDYGILKE